MSDLNEMRLIRSLNVFLGFLQSLFPSSLTRPEQKMSQDELIVNLISRQRTGCQKKLAAAQIWFVWCILGKTHHTQFSHTHYFSTILLCRS